MDSHEYDSAALWTLFFCLCYCECTCCHITVLTCVVTSLVSNDICWVVQVILLSLCFCTPSPIEGEGWV